MVMRPPRHIHPFSCKPLFVDGLAARRNDNARLSPGAVARRADHRTLSESRRLAVLGTITAGCQFGDGRCSRDGPVGRQTGCFAGMLRPAYRRFRRRQGASARRRAWAWEGTRRCEDRRGGASPHRWRGGCWRSEEGTVSRPPPTPSYSWQEGFHRVLRRGSPCTVDSATALWAVTRDSGSSWGRPSAMGGRPDF